MGDAAGEREWDRRPEHAALLVPDVFSHCLELAAGQVRQVQHLDRAAPVLLEPQVNHVATLVQHLMKRRERQAAAAASGKGIGMPQSNS